MFLFTTFMWAGSPTFSIDGTKKNETCQILSKYCEQTFSVVQLLAMFESSIQSDSYCVGNKKVGMKTNNVKWVNWEETYPNLWVLRLCSLCDSYLSYWFSLRWGTEKQTAAYNTCTLFIPNRETTLLQHKKQYKKINCTVIVNCTNHKKQNINLMSVFFPPLGFGLWVRSVPVVTSTTEANLTSHMTHDVQCLFLHLISRDTSGI